MPVCPQVSSNQYMLVYEWIEEGASVLRALELRLRMSHQHSSEKKM